MLEDVKNYFANFNGATNACRTVALWITLALAVAFVATKLYAFGLTKLGKRDAAILAESNRVINGGWIVAALIVAVGFIVTFAACYFVDVANDEDALVPILFYPLFVFAVVTAGSAAAIFFKPLKLVKIICGALVGCALIAVIACMASYYAGGDPGEAYSEIGLYLSAFAVVAGIIAFAFIADRNSGAIDTRTVTYAAVCVALSFALSYVRIFKMPMGGSITFASMLPLMLFAFMFGCRKGILVGLVYGVLQAVQDPWIIHPAQFALDYLAAFASIGLTGCMRNLGLFKSNMHAQFALGALIACAFRFVCHYFAGVFAFGMYGAGYAAEYGMPALANAYFYSFVYQCLYIVPELAIVLVAAMLALASKSFRRQIEIRIALSSKPSVSDTATSNTDALSVGSDGGANTSDNA